MSAELFVVLHVVASLMLGLVIRRIDKKIAFIVMLIILVIPFFGVLGVILFFALNQTNGVHLMLNDNEIMKNINGKFRLYKPVSYRNEADIMPLEDVLLLDDDLTKRELILDVIKRDASRYLEYLEIGLRNSDTETSHYSASAILQVKREFDMALLRLEVLYQKNRDDVTVVTDYADVLEKYVSSGLLDKRNLQKFRYMYVDVLRNIVKMRFNKVSTEKALNEMIEQLLLLRDYKEASEFADLYLSEYPNSEKAYLDSLKVMYERHDKRKFDQTLEKLSTANFYLSEQAMETVEFWKRQKT